MAYNGTAKVQHYVPQIILRNFTIGKKRQLFAFDKQEKKSFRTKPGNVACESRFYDFMVNDPSTDKEHILTLEHSLSELEGYAQTIFKNILEDDSLNVMSDSDKVMLSSFFAVQYTRTRNAKEIWTQLPIKFKDEIVKRFPSDKLPEDITEYFADRDENRIKIEMARIIIESPEKFGPHFLNRSWMLVKTMPSTPFIIGDNPIAIYSYVKKSYFDGIGIGVKSTGIYFPITPTRALLMLGSEVASNILQIKGLIEYSKINGLNLSTVTNEKCTEIELMHESLVSGKPFEYNKDNVTHFNALQVAFAERYIFSHINDFSLPKRMIKEQPALITGPRITLK